ncbi:hypothetical protein [Flavobacterium lindanitolerans]|uniref:hypothetical protein n=1 Tax=Flavobacterium lindanitolerans TaxID=428988 RepID=UPI002808FC90|nr:hypothetical protein [Flavobacterium lindanitolerans]MDQ7961069.1 hypothetical protein [Flavobacterium lindanitolerans]
MTNQTVWLSTSPDTRAEAFYRKCGWKETGLFGKGEIKFEMTAEKWKKSKEEPFSSKLIRYLVDIFLNSR